MDEKGKSWMDETGQSWMHEKRVIQNGWDKVIKDDGFEKRFMMAKKGKTGWMRQGNSRMDENSWSKMDEKK
jgi:stalled ribosome alternative rescue factor ArfA